MEGANSQVNGVMLVLFFGNLAFKSDMYFALR